jgi:hypothetical protein
MLLKRQLWQNGEEMNMKGQSWSSENKVPQRRKCFIIRNQQSLRSQLMRLGGELRNSMKPGLVLRSTDKSNQRLQGALKFRNRFLKRTDNYVNRVRSPLPNPRLRIITIMPHLSDLSLEEIPETLSIVQVCQLRNLT